MKELLINKITINKITIIKITYYKQSYYKIVGGTLVKHFHIIMAAFISGTVALFTSVLGVSGTIIGSVLSSFLYQLLSGYSEEKLEGGNLRKPKLANEIVYIFPLVVIGIFELIFLCSALHYRFDMLFDMLEAAVNNNLFRLMGLGLILLGAYPFFDSNNIDRRNGTFIIFLGILLFLRGLVDITDTTSMIFHTIFAQFDLLFAIFVVIGLALVIANILVGSGNLRRTTTDLVDTHKPKFTGAKKVDTSSLIEDLNEDVKLDESYLSEGNQGNDLANEDSHYNNNNANINANNDNQSADLNNPENPNQLPLYEEEVILVNNPEDPDNPIKKRILKRVKQDGDFEENDDYEDMYILDDVE